MGGKEREGEGRGEREGAWEEGRQRGKEIEHARPSLCTAWYGSLLLVLWVFVLRWYRLLRNGDSGINFGGLRNRMKIFIPIFFYLFIFFFSLISIVRHFSFYLLLYLFFSYSLRSSFLLFSPSSSSPDPHSPFLIARSSPLTCLFFPVCRSPFSLASPNPV